MPAPYPAWLKSQIGAFGLTVPSTLIVGIADGKPDIRFLGRLASVAWHFGSWFRI
jgi:hypothetical protein